MDLVSLRLVPFPDLRALRGLHSVALAPHVVANLAVALAVRADSPDFVLTLAVALQHLRLGGTGRSTLLLDPGPALVLVRLDAEAAPAVPLLRVCGVLLGLLVAVGAR